MEKYNLQGVEVFPFASRGELIDYVDAHKSILVAINAEKVMNSTPQTRAIINANTGYCDGIGPVLALRKHGLKNAVKIPGCELWLNIIDRFAGSKSFYLVGSKQEVIEATVAKLKQVYPTLNIVTYRNGYLKDDAEREALIADIAARRPDVVFVAMGSPKQELLLSEMQQRHPDAIYQGLGGSFDVYSGFSERAPKWWLDHNLEFLYRFLQNPKRLKRQWPIIKMAFKLLTNRI